jgi:hypothetical protein
LNFFRHEDNQSSCLWEAYPKKHHYSLLNRENIFTSSPREQNDSISLHSLLVENPFPFSISLRMWKTSLVCLSKSVLSISLRCWCVANTYREVEIFFNFILPLLHLCRQGILELHLRSFPGTEQSEIFRCNLHHVRTCTLSHHLSPWV